MTPQTKIDADDAPEQALWEGASGMHSAETRAAADEDPALAHQVRVLHDALGSLQRLEEPSELRSLIEARLDEELGTLTPPITPPMEAPRRILRATGSGPKRWRLALAAGVLVMAGGAAVVLLDSGSLVQPDVAGGAMGEAPGSRSSWEQIIHTARGTKIELLGTESLGTEFLDGELLHAEQLGVGLPDNARRLTYGAAFLLRVTTGEPVTTGGQQVSSEGHIEMLGPGLEAGSIVISPPGSAKATQFLGGVRLSFETGAVFELEIPIDGDVVPLGVPFSFVVDGRTTAGEILKSRVKTSVGSSAVGTHEFRWVEKETVLPEPPIRTEKQ